MFLEMISIFEMFFSNVKHPNFGTSFVVLSFECLVLQQKKKSWKPKNQKFEEKNAGW